MVCSICEKERPDRGSCKFCGSRLCSICRQPLPSGRKDERCQECNRERLRRDRESNPDRFRQYGRKWREENPEKHRACSRKLRDADPERDRARCRKWKSANLDKRRETEARRRARKSGCDVSPVNVQHVVEAASSLCAMCFAHVPEGLRHIDHIVPLDKGGPHSQENLQLLCYRCNTRKGVKLQEEVGLEVWVKRPNPSQPFLLNPNWG
jgi:5-methylcytosine-specific restriction endonuclease McrA